MFEIFNNLYMSIAEQMGVVLEKTSQSVTIKERLDFSCAIFSSDGNLIANAPHMPVHLGSMSASVKAVISQNPIIKYGDVFAAISLVIFLSKSFLTCMHIFYVSL